MLQQFNFQQQQQIRVLQNDGAVWFVAKDVCDALGLTNATETLRSLDDDEKLTSEILRSGQNRKMRLINESGLYNLIFRSNKPEARAFRKWVTSEVLPSIRQRGHYETGESKLRISHSPDAQSEAFFNWIMDNQDKDIRTHHISIYQFLHSQHQKQGFVEWFRCPFELAMAGAGIGSKKTYYKCLDDLTAWNLISYRKGVNEWRVSLFKIMPLPPEDTVMKILH